MMLDFTNYCTCHRHPQALQKHCEGSRVCSKPRSGHVVPAKLQVKQGSAGQYQAISIGLAIGLRAIGKTAV